MGASLRYEYKINDLQLVTVKVGAYNGQGESLNDVNNKKSFGARATAAVTPKIDVGGSWFAHDGITTVGGVVDSAFTNYAWGLDAQYGKPGDEGLYALGEYLSGTDATSSKNKIRGIQGLAAYNYRLKSPTSWLYAIEPALPRGPRRPEHRSRQRPLHPDHGRARLLHVEQGAVPGGVRAPELPGHRRAEHQRPAERPDRELLNLTHSKDRHMPGRHLLFAAAALTLAAPAAGQSLTGAGATFPNPIYTKWFDAYNKKTGVQINYQSIGSGGGIRQFTEGTVDFGATDGPMNESQIAAVNANVLHVPTVLGAVVVTYNLPGIGETRLKFDGNALVDIFMGRLTKWNDKKLAALNPGVKLPDQDIIVVHRSDGSGTTYIFTDYLNKFSREWKDKVGYATSVNWPVGLGGKGNEGVTQQVKQTEGAIGYVELIYALSNKLGYGEIKNASDKFVTPSLESVTAAAASAKLAKDTDFRVSITNAPGAEAYPIASFTWLLVQKDAKDAGKAKVVKDFLTWMISADAQKMAADLNYAPLPAEVVSLIQARLPTLKAGGKAIASN